MKSLKQSTAQKMVSHFGQLLNSDSEGLDNACMEVEAEVWPCTSHCALPLVVGPGRCDTYLPSLYLLASGYKKGSSRELNLQNFDRACTTR